MKIFFYHPSAHSDGFPEPPLGLGYLMGVAKKLGCEYKIYDQDHHSKFLSLEKMLTGWEPDLIAVTFMTPQYYAAKRSLELLRKKFPQAKFIVGGPHATALPEDTLKEMPEVDALCKGEGEKTFAEYIQHLKGEGQIEDIDGLYYRKGGEIKRNQPRELMNSGELNEYGIDWDKLMEFGPYGQKLAWRNEIVPVFPIITARGCPHKCTFCDEGNIWQRKVRMRTVENVIEEVNYLHDKYGAGYLNILDDTFTLQQGRVKEFCEKIKGKDIKFRITATIRSVEEEMLNSLAGAGCELIAYGVESGDNEVLRKMKKKQTVEDIKRTFELTRRAGIRSLALCMVGNIGEDSKAVEKTARLIKEIRADLASCTIMQPYPGSENYTVCKENGWILHNDWRSWVPSVLKTQGFRVVARTDKMDEKEILRAYYYMNRVVVLNRFRLKYGSHFLLRGQFYVNEIIPRLKTIGLTAFAGHVRRLFMGRYFFAGH